MLERYADGAPRKIYVITSLSRDRSISENEADIMDDPNANYRMFDYPDLDNLKKIITDHAKEAFFIDATDIALRVKTPILANIIMLGAFARWVGAAPSALRQISPLTVPATTTEPSAGSIASVER